MVTYQRLEKSMEEIIRRHELKNVLFEHQAMTLADADRFGKLCQELGVNEVWDSTLDNAINVIRSVKTPAEVEKIKAAQALTTPLLRIFCHSFKWGKRSGISHWRLNFL